MNDDLGDGLLGLATVVAESVPLEQTMLGVAEYAVGLTAHGAGAVLTTVEAGRPRITVATSAVVAEADEAQYAIAEGPCLTAVGDRTVVVSGSLAAEPRWPHYAGRVRRLGLQSVLANPLVLRDTVVAVLSIYAPTRDAFTESDVGAARHYSAAAATVVRNAEVLARSRAEIDQLRKALQVRPMIDQAIGIIRSRTGKSEDEAFERLRSISNRVHVRMSDVAARIIDDAVRRARERRRAS